MHKVVVTAGLVDRILNRKDGVSAVLKDTNSYVSFVIPAGSLRKGQLVDVVGEIYDFDPHQRLVKLLVLELKPHEM